MSIENDLPCHLKATRHEGALYLFAQNIDLGAGKDGRKEGQDIAPRAGTAMIAVPGLKAGTEIEVVGEGRTITARDGGFTDRFEPLAEHVYRLKR